MYEWYLCAHVCACGYPFVPSWLPNPLLHQPPILSFPQFVRSLLSSSHCFFGSISPPYWTWMTQLWIHVQARRTRYSWCGFVLTNFCHKGRACLANSPTNDSSICGITAFWDVKLLEILMLWGLTMSLDCWQYLPHPFHTSLSFATPLGRTNMNQSALGLMYVPTCNLLVYVWMCVCVCLCLYMFYVCLCFLYMWGSCLCLFDEVDII